MDQNTQQTPAQTSRQAPSSVSSQNYFNKLFSGRLNRRNFFIGASILMILNVTFEVLMYPNIQPVSTSMNLGQSAPSLSTAFALVPFSLLFLSFSVSLSIRRLHDLNKTGWFILVMYIPLIGAFYAFYVLFAPGTERANKYGSQPLARIDIREDI